MTAEINAMAADELRPLLEPGEELLWASIVEGERVDRSRGRTVRRVLISMLVALVAFLTLAFLDQRDVSWALSPIARALGRLPDVRAVTTMLQFLSAIVLPISLITSFFIWMDGTPNELPTQVRGLSHERLIVVERGTGPKTTSFFRGSLLAIERTGNDDVAELGVYTTHGEHQDITLPSVLNAAEIERLLIQTLKPKPEKAT